ncbi:hypothetical protein [Bosea sp. LjRoot237]|uniref:hypothetical protein n=1 Tax=Bosea sp. LjRoot237 TaxID=3342292 RepID=UPI003ED085E2
MTSMIERVAGAIEEADVGFSLRLTRLVDEVHTYTLMYSDGVGPFEYEDIDDGYAHVRERKFNAKARAAIAAMREGLPRLQGESWFECIATECESAGTDDGTWVNLKALAEWADSVDAALEEKP